ncbi:hypothetical protein KTH73_11760 [Acinetobacter courvalinii]|uniref:hypothetical protein n=1 Tax=Acinetobacter courvalinii TaxID=280147 RepID=UPI0021CDD858|nr:hypothetical protein [Acinetobacter courvalinii]MCU4391396.1 hypothetical protein [Acinetobacter courvalinii]MCU4577772.1 hypothetical protein [Acinetobacter courvalinii]
MKNWLKSSGVFIIFCAYSAAKNIGRGGEKAKVDPGFMAVLFKPAQVEKGKDFDRFNALL